MIFTQHYLACLSQASYIVGDETTGRAVVVDPRRDIQVYLEEAAAEGLTIERVIETHVHADFLAGHLELAARTGAVICFGEGTDVAFPAEALHDGQRLEPRDLEHDRGRGVGDLGTEARHLRGVPAARHAMEDRALAGIAAHLSLVRAVHHVASA